jgi:hypothetical protein
VSLLILLFSNINRPDAGLYHLPFTKILTEHKILIGIVNLHGRFGHISIIQYISTLFENSFFREKGILIPISLLSCVFLTFLFRVIIHFNKFNFSSIEKFFIYGMLLFSITILDRYSDYGNDIPGSIIILIAIIYTLKNIYTDKLPKERSINIILLLCTFSIFNKIFLIFSAILVLLNLDKDYLKNLIKNKIFYFCSIFIILWILKNILISGCIVYPKKELCFQKLSWYNSEQTEIAELEAEAWAKSWPEQKKKYPSKEPLNFIEFNDNFNWFDLWLETHFINILQKILPFNILIFLLLFFLVIKNKNNILDEKKNNQNNSIFKIFIFAVISICFWFFKFPLYRFGAVFIYTCNLLIQTYIFYLFSKKINFIISQKTSITILIFSFIVFFLINANRIVSSSKKSYWPYFNYNIIKKDDITKNLNGIKILKSKELCFYKQSPCTHLNLENLQVKKRNNYFIFFKK